MMQRREFSRNLAIGAVWAGASTSVQAQTPRAPRKNTLMHVGGDYHSVAGSGITSRENLEYNLRYGVKHLTAQVRKGPGGGWDADELKKMKDDCDKYGVDFEAIRMSADYITLRKGPERDRELDSILGNIEKASQVGVKIITYHWTVIPIRRNAHTPGRGGVTYASFQLVDDWNALPLEQSGRGSSDAYCERITT